MNKFSPWVVIVLLLAVIAGGLLVKRSADLRRGAAGANMAVNFLASKETIEMGEEVEVSVAVNSGNRPLSAVDVEVETINSNLEILSAEAVRIETVRQGEKALFGSGYDCSENSAGGLLCLTTNKDAGKVTIRGVSMEGELPTGVISVMRLRLRARAAGESGLRLAKAEMATGGGLVSGVGGSGWSVVIREDGLVGSGEGTASFSSGTGDFIVGSDNEVAVTIDGGNMGIISAEVSFSYDNLGIEISDLGVESGFELVKGEVGGGRVSLNIIWLKARSEAPKGKVRVASFKVRGLAEGTYEAAFGSDLRVIADNAAEGQKLALKARPASWSFRLAEEGARGASEEETTVRVTYLGAEAENVGCDNNRKVNIKIEDGQGRVREWDGIEVKRSSKGVNYQYKYNGKTVSLVLFEGKVDFEGWQDREGARLIVGGYGTLEKEYVPGQVGVKWDDGLIDASELPLIYGDVSGENGADGVIDARDYIFVRGQASLRQNGDMRADIDGNCILNSVDLTTLMVSLLERKEEIF